MVLLRPAPPPPTTALYSTHPLKPTLSRLTLKPFYHGSKTHNKNKAKRGICRAEFSQDAPFAAAIGVSMLSSLLFPVTGSREEEDGDSAINLGDMRFAAMGIISFIPYFNWLSWVFAWLDTGKRRYALYSLVYLAPYLRSNLSLSPEESWLPIASIVFGIIHVQLEASISNGDIQGFQLFSRATDHFSSINRKKDSHVRGDQGVSKARKQEEQMNLPNADQKSRNEIRQWGVPKKPSEHHEQSNDGWDDDERSEQ
ncbi:hypothetical protein SLE2022_339360 [Rubroshorea leprosula]